MKGPVKGPVNGAVSSYSDKFESMISTFESIFEKVIDKRRSGGSMRLSGVVFDTRPKNVTNGTDSVLAKLVDLVSRHKKTIIYNSSDRLNGSIVNYYLDIKDNSMIKTSFNLLFPLLFMKLLVDNASK